MGIDLYISDENYHYTYNVSKMWYEIFPDDDGMVHIEGMTGKKAKKKIKKAIIGVVKHSEKLRAMNPLNGWGSYNGFLGFLIKILEECENHPNDVWSCWR